MSFKNASCACTVAVVAFVMAAACFILALTFAAQPAWADVDTDLADAQTAVEQSASDYAQAQAKAEEVDRQIAELSDRIGALQEQMPAQRAASNESLRVLYKLQQEGCSLLDMILGSNNIADFLRRIDCVNRIQSANQAQLDKLLQMESELSTNQTQLVHQKEEAEVQRRAAEEALARAQSLRESAQAAAEAQRAAEAQAAADAAAAGETTENIPVEVPSDANQGSQAVEQPSENTIQAPPASDHADWSTDKETFVNEWTPRIDAYLSGSPLAGYGKSFAAAAWDYGVDPRWSPAISCIESTKGQFCFRLHNAWGWGSSSWDTWEEAIEAHVRGLSRGYGYTISIANAQKYCPPNWEFWYNRVSEEMNKI